jgi:ATP-dependent DNA helicase PIF1
MLDVGEGNIQAVTKEGEFEPSWIKIPYEFLLKPNDNNISCMVNDIYSELESGYMDFEYLRTQAILNLTNDIVDTINNYIVSLVPGDEN